MWNSLPVDLHLETDTAVFRHNTNLEVVCFLRFLLLLLIFSLLVYTKQESLANTEVSARQLCRFETDCEMKLRIKVIVWSIILQSITHQQRQYIAK